MPKCNRCGMKAESLEWVQNTMICAKCIERAEEFIEKVLANPSPAGEDMTGAEHFGSKGEWDCWCDPKTAGINPSCPMHCESQEGTDQLHCHRGD